MRAFDVENNSLRNQYRLTLKLVFYYMSSAPAIKQKCRILLAKLILFISHPSDGKVYAQSGRVFYFIFFVRVY